MKKIVFILSAFVVIFLQSCSGPEGARGPQGHPGPASEVFEVTTSFINNNDFSSTFRLTPAIYPSDVVLVYELAQVFNGQDVWKLLPQTYYSNGGEFRYNFDFTSNDFRLFIESPDGFAYINALDPSWKNSITFRIVIVPGYFSTLGVDFNDINAVMNSLSLTDDSFIQL